MVSHYHSPTSHNRAAQNLCLAGRKPEHHKSLFDIQHHYLARLFQHLHDVTFLSSETLDGLKYCKTSLSLSYMLKIHLESGLILNQFYKDQHCRYSKDFGILTRSEEHTSELRHVKISYA